MAKIGFSTYQFFEVSYKFDSTTLPNWIHPAGRWGMKMVFPMVFLISMELRLFKIWIAIYTWIWCLDQGEWPILSRDRFYYIHFTVGVSTKSNIEWSLLISTYFSPPARWGSLHVSRFSRGCHFSVSLGVSKGPTLLPFLSPLLARWTPYRQLRSGARLDHARGQIESHTRCQIECH